MQIGWATKESKFLNHVSCLIKRDGSGSAGLSPTKDIFIEPFQALVFKWLEMIKMHCFFSRNRTVTESAMTSAPSPLTAVDNYYGTMLKAKVRVNLNAVGDLVISLARCLTWNKEKRSFL